MKRITRTLLTAAVAVAFAAVPVRAADVDKLLPAETEGYMFVNFKQVIDSELIKKFAMPQIKQALEGKQAKQMTQALGLDPLKDLDTLTVGLWGDDPQNMKFLAVMRGKFDPKKLFEVVEAESKKNGDKVSIITEGDYKMVKVTPDNSPDPIYMSVADEKSIVASKDKKLVVSAMKAAEGGSTPAVKKELVELVKKMDEKASMFLCGVSTGKVGDLPPIPGIDDPEKLKKQLEKMDTQSMTLRVTGDVAFNVVLTMKDEAAATDFGETVDDLLGKAKALLPLVAGQQPMAKPLVQDLTKSLKSTVEKKDINITVKLTGAAISKVMPSDE